jgi:hypothetical protein
MCPSSASNTDLGRGRLARIATIEGYLAILLTLLSVLPLKVMPPVPEPYVLPVGVSIWAGAWLFSISGTRHGHGYGRLAAGLSLTFLSLQAIGTVYLLLGGAAVLTHHR